MKKSITRNIITVVAVVAISGIGSSAFAGWGMGNCGNGGHQRAGQGQHDGYGRYQGACMEYGGGRKLDNETVKKLNTERQNFYEATEDVRKKLFQKDLELRSEFAKDTPDAKTAAGIQKQISNLESDFHQKKVIHIIAMKKIDPDFRPGFGAKGRKACGMAAGRQCR